MKNILVLSFIFLSISAWSGNHIDKSSKKKIDQLGWSTFSFGINYFGWFLHVNKTDTMINLDNKLVINYLLEKIQNPSQTVIIHILLSNKFDHIHNVAYEDITDGFDTLNQGGYPISYEYNRLTWKEFVDSNGLSTYYIDRSEIQKIYKYWRKRLLHQKGYKYHRN